MLKYQPDLQSSSEYQSGLLFSHHTTFLRLTDISMKQYLYYCNILHFIFQHLWQWQSKIVSDSLSQESLYQVPLVLFAFFFFSSFFLLSFYFTFFPSPESCACLGKLGRLNTAFSALSAVIREFGVQGKVQCIPFLCHSRSWWVILCSKLWQNYSKIGYIMCSCCHHLYNFQPCSGSLTEAMPQMKML